MDKMEPIKWDIVIYFLIFIHTIPWTIYKILLFFSLVIEDIANEDMDKMDKWINGYPR